MADTPIFDEVASRRSADGLDWSVEARRALVLADEEAASLGHGHVGTEHVLLGLLGVAGPVGTFLRAAGFELSTTRRTVAAIVPASTPPGRREAVRRWSTATADVFAAARHAAAHAGVVEVGTAELLQALIYRPGFAATLLTGLHVAGGPAGSWTPRPFARGVRPGAVSRRG